MALKRNHSMTAAFSMASMTDVIFLLLIFFMVTSTVVFPTALEVNLPESSRQTAIKPSTRVYIDAEGDFYVSVAGSEPVRVELDALEGALLQARSEAGEETDDCVAVYADEAVPYGTLVKVLDRGAAANLKMVLATKPAPESAKSTADTAEK
ncbi:MAG: biopolymer transporter ExbD [Duncaniella sp.]|nr:biopolymer transporter ExbD [Duncaniella sp.]